MRWPRKHQADETVARILVAAKRVENRATPPELEPADEELVDMPLDMLPPPELEQQQGAPPQQQQQGAPELPPLDESGLDTGMVLQGRDSFDALLGG